MIFLHQTTAATRTDPFVGELKFHPTDGRASARSRRSVIAESVDALVMAWLDARQGVAPEACQVLCARNMRGPIQNRT